MYPLGTTIKWKLGTPRGVQPRFRRYVVNLDGRKLPEQKLVNVSHVMTDESRYEFGYVYLDITTLEIPHGSNLIPLDPRQLLKETPKLLIRWPPLLKHQYPRHALT